MLPSLTPLVLLRSDYELAIRLSNVISFIVLYYRPGEKEITGRPPVVRYFLSQPQGDFDDEAANPFQQDGNGSQLGENRRMLVAADFRFDEDVKIFFGSRICSFGGRSQSFEFLMALGSPDNLGNQPWKLDDGHMLAESVIVNPVRAVVSEPNNCFIF